MWFSRSKTGFTLPSRAALRKSANNAYLGDGLSLCRVLDRYKMYVPVADMSVTPHLLMDGVWEPWVTRAIADRLRPGMVCADVGANVGYFSLLMADLTGEMGYVHAFEPNPDLIDLINRSAVVNGFAERLGIHSFPLGHEEGREMLLVIPEGYLGGAATWEMQAGPVANSYPVKTSRLDGVAGADKIQFVKIDAEGSEPSIWAGMRGLLARPTLQTVFIEFTAGHYDDPGDFLDQLLAPGFSLSIVDQRKGVVPLSREQLFDISPEIGPMLVLER
jgi:FkbM family methyltransferase